MCLIIHICAWQMSMENNLESPLNQLSDGERLEVLANVAQMYYVQGLNQTVIAKKMGVDRSTVSRMLTEARRQKIVEIRINHPISTHSELEKRLEEKYGLKRACVVVNQAEEYTQLLRRLGIAGANLLMSYLTPNQTLGLSWGTAVSAVVDAIQMTGQAPLRIVQLVGAMGAHNDVYDGRGLVHRLAQKLGSDAYFLNAPFLVESPEVARALKSTPSISEALTLGRECDIALMGIGSTETAYSSFYQAGYISLEELEALQACEMVGDVCGLHFDIEGGTPELGWHKRIITIQPEDLRIIPLRIGMAGGIRKLRPIQGALHTGYLNILITDEAAARELMKV